MKTPILSYNLTTLAVSVNLIQMHLMGTIPQDV